MFLKLTIKVVAFFLGHPCNRDIHETPHFAKIALRGPYGMASREDVTTLLMQKSRKSTLSEVKLGITYRFGS